MLKVTKIVNMTAGTVNTFLTMEELVRSLVSKTSTTRDMWSPALFLDGYRSNKNWLSTPSVFVIDIDEHLTVEQAKTRLSSYNLNGAILSTRNHQKVKGDKPACDRFRVVLQLTSPIDNQADYAATWAFVATLFPEMDAACKDESRGYYYSTELLYEDYTGAPVTPKKAEAVVAVTAPTVNTKITGKLARATVDFLAQEPSSDSWHQRFVKAAFDIKAQGYTVTEATEKLSRASNRGQLDSEDMRQLRDVYQNRESRYGPRIAWPEMLPPPKNGTAKPNPYSVRNLQYMLTDLLGTGFKRNLRREVTYIVEGTKEPRALTNSDIAKLSTKAREFGLMAGPPLEDLITSMAADAAFDPLLQSLAALPEAKIGNISELFNTLVLPDDTTEAAKQQYQLMLRRWLIGAVRKAHEPGSENNVLVFQGRQAAGKSRWLKRLASIWPDGWGEGGVSPDDKDHEMRHLDNFIWHVAEFDSTTSRREVGALKDYFTKDTVTVRRPYAKLPIIGQSICSFCASVNSFDFLHDATGNRRYLVIPVVALDALHKVDIAAVWSEAQAAYLAGERQWFSVGEIEEINRLNTRFMSREEYLDELSERAVPGNDALSIKQIMEIISFGNVQISKPVRSNVRAVLDRAGVKIEVKGTVTRFLVDKNKLIGQNNTTSPGGLQWKQ